MVGIPFVVRQNMDMALKLKPRQIKSCVSPNEHLSGDVLLEIGL